MTNRTVGPTSTYDTITEAIDASIGGDTIVLEDGYGGETALVDVQNLTVWGAASSTNILLNMGEGVGDIILAGKARIDVNDNSGANTITGNNGANTIAVSAGADVVHGGLGNDRLIIDYALAGGSVIGTTGGVTDGGIHSVTFDGVENFNIFTGAGNDTITTADGDNIIVTAGGDDTITTGQGGSLIYSGDGNDTVTTGDGGNTVNGGSGDNTITTGSGADSVSTGGSGNDTIETNAGNDIVSVAGGLDTVDSGAGSDQLTVRYANALSAVTAHITSGSFAAGYAGLVADGDGNSVSFTGIERFDITAGGGNDNLTTGGGADSLTGRSGDDLLDSRAGKDVLEGGNGADTLVGGRDADLLSGGKDADVFRFDEVTDSTARQFDTITDLTSSDVIDLSRVDADSTQAGNQAFTLVDKFSGQAGEATFSYAGSTNQTILKVDVDGDGLIDMRIAIDGDHTDFSNFVL